MDVGYFNTSKIFCLCQTNHFNCYQENNSDFLDDIEQTFQEHRRKELELNQREEDLKKRENTLNQKETALDEREEEYDNMLFRQRFVREREKYLHDLEKSCSLFPEKLKTCEIQVKR